MRSLALAVCTILLLSACGPKRPVLYPNARYRDIGKPAANEIVSSCMDRARAAGVGGTRSGGAAKGATGGATLGALLGGAVGWIFGNPGRGAAAGAVHGGGTGAVHGASNSGEGSQTFRGYVEACLHEAGLQPVGWE